MKNPLRSEAEAFQFLLGAAVYFGLIAIAGVINAWAGLAVFIVLTLFVIWWWLRARRIEAQTKTVPVHRGGPGERRLLVIANETVGGGPLRERIERLSEGYDTKVLVVTPALNTRVRTITSDVDPAREQAQKRLEASLARLHQDGIDARGEGGGGDPLQATPGAARTLWGGPD